MLKRIIADGHNWRMKKGILCKRSWLPRRYWTTKEKHHSLAKDNNLQIFIELLTSFQINIKSQKIAYQPKHHKFQQMHYFEQILQSPEKISPAQRQQNIEKRRDFKASFFLGLIRGQSPQRKENYTVTQREGERRNFISINQEEVVHNQLNYNSYNWMSKCTISDQNLKLNIIILKSSYLKAKGKNALFYSW